jgi:hypothetical protein
LRFGKIEFAAAALTAGMAAGGASAQTLAPLSFPVGDSELRLDAEASGADFAPGQPGRGGIAASGAFSLKPQLRRDYDSGLSLGLSGTFVAADPLSRGRYDGDVIERLAGEARTGLGKAEVGITDGAGYALAVTGPKVDPGVSLDDARTSFFRDPGTHRAVSDMFALRTEAGASSNYAKFVYTSPSLLGVQIALSYAPSQGKQLPFLNAGPHVADRQADFYEAALRYETEVGPVSLAGYGAFVESRAEHKLPGQEGVSDLAAGLRADYPVNDDITVSLGGSWRQSNAYAFDINQAWQGATTRGQHVSAMLADGAWSAGIEYGNGVAKPVASLPRLGLNGSQASVGYQVSNNIMISAGWQRLGYSRDSGVFFNGAPQLKMDAVYLHLNLKTSEQ